MIRLPLFGGCIFAWLVSACAATTPSETSTGSRRGDEACSSLAQAQVSEATSKRLSSASNVIEYQSIWQQEHPGASLGTASQSAIRAFIHSKGPEIRDCYQAALDELPEGRGRVSARFVIAADGSVPNVSISSSNVMDPEVGCCLATQIAQWTFPAPAGGDFVAVEYPFVVSVSHGP